MTEKNNLGKLIKKRRVKKNMTLAELAKKVGLGTQQAICNIERGVHVLRPSSLKPFLKVLKISKKDALKAYVSDIKNEFSKGE